MAPGRAWQVGTWRNELVELARGQWCIYRGDTWQIDRGTTTTNAVFGAGVASEGEPIFPRAR